jgi:hypothetical protein
MRIGPEVGIQHRHAIVRAGNRIAGFAALLLRVENAVASRKPRSELFFGGQLVSDVMEQGQCYAAGLSP